MSETLSLRRFLPRFLRSGSENGKAMIHSRGSSGVGNWLFPSFFGTSALLPNTNYDYAQKVGDGLGSSVLAGPLNFLMRTFPEAPPIVKRRKKDQWEEEVDHVLTTVIDNPNSFYSGRVLLMCTILDFAFGNAFWYKIRNKLGDVVQLWWIPRNLIRPIWPQNGTVFISHYEYFPGGEPVKLPVEDVVHFRFGIDPRNPRLGLSQLGALMREVGIDDEAANFTGTVLRNLGVIGVVIAPKEKGAARQEDVDAVKLYIKQAFTGDKRGEPLALGAPTDVNVLQYNMQGFDVSPIRDVGEERVCAALGLPAAVVGFGTGLQQTKVGATMKEMRQLAWTGGIIPMQEIIAAEINRSLLPEFEGGRRQKAQFCFDTSKVRALWEDNNEKHQRVREDYKAKLIDRATALRETGRAVRPEDEGVYFSGPVEKEPANPKNPAPAAPALEEEDDAEDQD